MILVMGCVFVFWAFFSFFVHMLVAVLFPVVAGLVLGFWVYMWRWVQYDIIIMTQLRCGCIQMNTSGWLSRVIGHKLTYQVLKEMQSKEGTAQTTFNLLHNEF